MDGLVRLGTWVDDVAAALALQPNETYALRLCLEEATANLVMHGVPASDAQPDTFDVTIEATDTQLRVAVTDRCIAFNPLDVDTPEPLVDLESARIGGLGIHLMRQYAQDVAYVSEASHNRLSLVIDRGA